MEVLFIKFNYADMLNQYLTNIYVLKNNIYNFYFNIKGEGSIIEKEKLKNDLIKLDEFYMKLSLLIKKIGSYPIMNLEEIIKISTIKEVSSKDYTPKTINNILLTDYKLLNNMNNQVGEYVLKNYDLKSINLILDFNNYLQDKIYNLNINIF